ncbi:HAD family hydrolase [Leptolyngbya iicbica]|uniref:HAD family hydrolase n=2 Tax=Cyanophyceae TaxID=3028117 RepID=A0A4Q7E2C2_9CYAN|nr:hypothetical protein [Leptolyngbya sp. LK]RZM75685.1 hypothetical protein DYY88_20505 [Leptolyngbya sp. LK]
MVKIASFDVFDTVLTRTVGSPESSFLLLGKKLQQLSLIDCSAEAFARIRQAAEQRAFDNAGGLDSNVTLEQIYREVGVVLRLPASHCNQLMAVEEQLEAALLQPIPACRAKLQAARDRGEKILFLSDMYIGHRFIQSQLERHGLFLPGDRLYVSCDYAQSKASGQLYDTMLQREAIEPAAASHCGNSQWSDVGAAKRAGLRVEPFLQGNLNRYEKILESYTWQTEGLSSAVAGAARLARLTVPAPCKRTQALRDVAAGVAAPLLIGFTLWTLKRAQQLGLKRLYFVARDGQILLEIARRLLPKLDFDCELCYLYGSRQAWLLPSLTTLDETELDGIFPLSKDVDYLSVRIVLARFALEPEAIAEPLERLGLSAQNWERNLSAAERQRLRQALLTEPELRQQILQSAAQQRAVMMQYLEQEGLLETQQVGFIDLGTGATLHLALATVLATAQIEPPASFYLGLRAEVKPTRYPLPEVYLYDARFKLGFLDRPGLTGFLESVCSADHGSVIGYQVQGDRVEPLLAAESNERIMDWGFPLVRETMCCVADQLLLDAALLNPQANLCEALLEAFSQFWQFPTPAEAAAWGAFPLEDGWGKAACYLTLAEPYRWGDVIVLNKHRHWWYEGALAQTSPLLRQAFRLRRLAGAVAAQAQQQRSLKQVLKGTVQVLLQPSTP